MEPAASRTACVGLAVLLLALDVSFARADDAALSGDATWIEIAPAVLVLVDETSSLDATSVAALPSERFRRAGGPHPSFGFTGAALWFRFSLSNGAESRRAFVLDAGREWLDDVDLYLVSAQGVRDLAHSGASVPLSERPIPTERIVFPIGLAAHEHASYLLRIRSPSPIAFDAVVWDARAFEEHQGVEEALFGGYYGVLSALAVYGLLLYLALRERSQLIAAVMLASWMLGEACAHGHVARVLPSLAGEVETRGPALAFAITAGTAWTWLRTLSPLRASSPVRSIERVARPLVVGITATPLLVPSLAFLTYVGLVIFAASIIVESVRAVRSKRRDVRFFALAIAAWTTCGIGPLGVFFGVLPAYGAVEYGAHIGAIAMACLLSLLLVDAIRTDRESIVSLHQETGALNASLTAQLATVEAHAKEIGTLNAELSYQVAARSRELVDLLAKQETLPSAHVPQPGDIFDGRYRILHGLGAGAWGIVYEVERLSDARRLALKLVTRASTGAEAARVAREAEIGARLRHPNLVAIVDVGVAFGVCPFLVMELVVGGSLESRRVAFGSPSWALPILHQIARGLAALHAAQVVHRDVKPANILVDEVNGELVARVADFGIARPDERKIDPLGATITPQVVRRSPKLTHADAMVGTPLYMPPEAARPGGVGTAGDVFAFGVVAYEMITGVGPYAGPTVFLALAGEALPPPRTLDGHDLAQDVRDCLERCVAHDPALRPTMLEVEALLARFARARSTPAARPDDAPR